RPVILYYSYCTLLAAFSGIICRVSSFKHWQYRDHHTGTHVLAAISCSPSRRSRHDGSHRYARSRGVTHHNSRWFLGINSLRDVKDIQ
ncbi:hypothetical protein FKP32DRAFT_1762853, partial [Trametes sanguinea]